MKVRDRIQWENIDDLFLFILLGILAWLFLSYGLEDAATNLGSFFAGAVSMYLRGNRKINANGGQEHD